MWRSLTRSSIVGILFSLLVGTLAWLFTREPVTSLMLAVVTELLALMIDTRLDTTRELRRLREAANLLNDLMEDRESSDTLVHIAKDYATVARSRPSLFREHARNVLIKMSDQLAQLARGRMELDAPMYALKGPEILRGLKSSGFATALVWREKFWFEDLGQQYHKEGMAAAKRGVKMKRVFLLEDRQVAVPPRFVQLIDQQAAAGIDVHIAYRTELHPTRLIGFGIWDDTIVLYTHWAPDSSTRLGATLHSTEAELLTARNLRDLILEDSVEWDSVREIHSQQDRADGSPVPTT